MQPQLIPHEQEAANALNKAVEVCLGLFPRPRTLDGFLASVGIWISTPVILAVWIVPGLHSLMQGPNVGYRLRVLRSHIDHR